MGCAREIIAIASLSTAEDPDDRTIRLATTLPLRLTVKLTTAVPRPLAGRLKRCRCALRVLA